jgi:hypothetical protein
VGFWLGDLECYMVRHDSRDGCYKAAEQREETFWTW